MFFALYGLFEEHGEADVFGDVNLAKPLAVNRVGAADRTLDICALDVDPDILGAYAERDELARADVLIYVCPAVDYVLRNGEFFYRRTRNIRRFRRALRSRAE